MHAEQCVPDTHMQLPAQACRSVYTKIYVPIVINMHMRRFMPTLPTPFMRGSTVYGQIHRHAQRQCPSKCVKSNAHTKSLCSDVSLHVCLYLLMSRTDIHLSSACISVHTLETKHSPMCTCLQLLPHIPASSTVCIYVDVWLQVYVYMQSTCTPTQSQGHSIQKFSSQAGCTCSLSGCRPIFARNSTYMQLLTRSWANAQLDCSAGGT